MTVRPQSHRHVRAYEYNEFINAYTHAEIIMTNAKIIKKNYKFACYYMYI